MLGKSVGKFVVHVQGWQRVVPRTNFYQSRVFESFQDLADEKNVVVGRIDSIPPRQLIPTVPVGSSLRNTYQEIVEQNWHQYQKYSIKYERQFGISQHPIHKRDHKIIQRVQITNSHCSYPKRRYGHIFVNGPQIVRTEIAL